MAIRHPHHGALLVKLQLIFNETTLIKSDSRRIRFLIQFHSTPEPSLTPSKLQHPVQTFFYSPNFFSPPWIQYSPEYKNSPRGRRVDPVFGQWPLASWEHPFDVEEFRSDGMSQRPRGPPVGRPRALWSLKTMALSLQSSEVASPRVSRKDSPFNSPSHSYSKPQYPNLYTPTIDFYKTPLFHLLPCVPFPLPPPLLLLYGGYVCRLLSCACASALCAREREVMPTTEEATDHPTPLFPPKKKFGDLFFPCIRRNRWVLSRKERV